MANWKYKLELADLRKQYDKEKITISEFGKAISKRIEKLTCYSKDDELQEISDNFQYVEDEDDFDDVLNSLYDWGDTITGKSNRLWW